MVIFISNKKYMIAEHASGEVKEVGMLGWDWRQ